MACTEALISGRAKSARKRCVLRREIPPLYIDRIVGLYCSIRKYTSGTF